MSSSCHFQPGDSGRRAQQGAACDTEEVARVVARPSSVREHLLVAGQLLLEVEASHRPPCERVEPVGSAGEARRHAHCPVEPDDVDQLVQQHRPPPVTRPGVSVDRYQHHGTQHSHCGRDLHFRAGQQAHAAPAARAPGGLGQQGKPVCVGDGAGPPEGSRDAPQADAEVKQQRAGAEHPESHEPHLPVDTSRFLGGHAGLRQVVRKGVIERARLDLSRKVRGRDQCRGL